MADNIHEIASREQFEQLIASGTVLIDFYATWCGPCRMQVPILHEIADEVKPARIAKVNVDHLPELAAQFGVSGIPHLSLVQEGRVVNEFIGLQNAATLLQAIERVKPASV